MCYTLLLSRPSPPPSSPLLCLSLPSVWVLAAAWTASYTTGGLRLLVPVLSCSVPVAAFSVSHVGLLGFVVRGSGAALGNFRVALFAAGTVPSFLPFGFGPWGVRFFLRVVSSASRGPDGTLQIPYGGDRYVSWAAPRLSFWPRRCVRSSSLRWCRSPPGLRYPASPPRGVDDRCRCLPFCFGSAPVATSVLAP